jgi:hypothetical protein
MCTGSSQTLIWSSWPLPWAHPLGQSPLWWAIYPYRYFGIALARYQHSTHSNAFVEWKWKNARVNGWTVNCLQRLLLRAFTSFHLSPSPEPQRLHFFVSDILIKAEWVLNQRVKGSVFSSGEKHSPINLWGEVGEYSRKYSISCVCILEMWLLLMSTH